MGMPTVKLINLSGIKRLDTAFYARTYIDTDDILMLSVSMIDTTDAKRPQTYEIDFNADWIPDDKLQWLTEVLAMNLYDTVRRAQFVLQNDIQMHAAALIKLSGLSKIL
jgi:hypothetical protein